MGARLIGVATVVLMALGLAFSGTALAGGSITLTLDYSGVYNFKNTESFHGTASGTVDQSFSTGMPADQNVALGTVSQFEEEPLVDIPDLASISADGTYGNVQSPDGVLGRHDQTTMTLERGIMFPVSCMASLI